MAANGRLDDLDIGSSHGTGAGDASACIGPLKGLYGPICAPLELMDFLRAQSVRDAAQTLGLARGTVHRLVNGYWPSDSRKIMQAWSAYQGRTGVAGTSWFIRRVRAGGVVRHAGQDFTAHELAARTGRLLAVTRLKDGRLLAQTLELPSARMPLVPVAQLQGGPA